MKLKNTRELVLRARAHARHDHVQQGTYGRGSVNGDVRFKGCAIGCLATPHRKSELRSFLRSLFGGPQLYYKDFSSQGLNSDGMVGKLRREFGINWALARAAESFFEAQPTHGAAINFIPAFAAALNEGANITPGAVRRFWYKHRIGFNDSLRDVYVYDYEASGPTSEQVKVLTPIFLDWLRSQTA